MSDDDSFDDVEYEDGKRHNVTNLYSNRYAEERVFDDDSYDSEEDEDYEDVETDSEDPYEYDEDYESSSEEEEDDDDLT